MKLSSLLTGILISFLGFAVSVIFAYYVVHATDAPEAREHGTKAFTLFFVIPLVIFSFPGLTCGLPSMSSFPPRLWLGGSLAFVGCYALYNLTTSLSIVPPHNQIMLAMMIAAGPVFLVLVWLMWRSMHPHDPSEYLDSGWD